MKGSFEESQGGFFEGSSKHVGGIDSNKRRKKKFNGRLFFESCLSLRFL
jgi:hypothetical protein